MIALLLPLLSPVAAGALPKYAQKERKPCAFCHANPRGGGARNAAGAWYEEHGLSLAGYPPTPARPAGTAAAPSAPRPARAKAKPAAKKPGAKTPNHKDTRKKP